MQYRIENNKVYNEHDEVAVLVSPGYGAGWYSWNTQHPECLFDTDCVMALLNDEDVDVVAHRKFGEDFYSGGAQDLRIEWVPSGTKFRVHEYDGSEYIVFSTDEDWHVA